MFLIAEAKPTITITINEKIEPALKDGYTEYLEKAEEEDLLTEEEFNLHILKLGILSNNITKNEIELSNKKSELSSVKSELVLLKNEYRTNRKRIKTLYDYE